jgi:hypothetical protein
MFLVRFDLHYRLVRENSDSREHSLRRVTRTIARLPLLVKCQPEVSAALEIPSMDAATTEPEEGSGCGDLLPLSRTNLQR